MKKKNILLIALAAVVFVQLIIIVGLWTRKAKLSKLIPPEDLTAEKLEYEESIPEEVALGELVTKKVSLEELPEKIMIAVIIDDWGYNKRNEDFIKNIEVPFTVSILPNLRYSEYIAKLASSFNKEVIVHLPLEPHEDRKVGLEKNVILTNMSDAEIIAIFQEAFASVPHSEGISNHMGSKATENKRVMSILFEEFKKHDLYFVDNLVTPKTICEDAAGQIDLEFTKRDIFIDNESSPDYIRNQLRKLIITAKRRGYAVGVAHDRPGSLKTIRTAIPEIEEEGITFVRISELLDEISTRD